MYAASCCGRYTNRIERKTDGENSGKITIQQHKYTREKRRTERFARAGGCNKLKSILLNCTFYASRTKKGEASMQHIHALTENKEGKINAKDVTKGRERGPAVFQIE